MTHINLELMQLLNKNIRMIGIPQLLNQGHAPLQNKITVLSKE